MERPRREVPRFLGVAGASGSESERASLRQVRFVMGVHTRIRSAAQSAES